MTKTELRKLTTKSVMNMLIKDFNAYHIEDTDGGRISFCIDSDLDNTFWCEFHSTNLDVCIHENMKLAGDGWSIDEINKAAEADVYETKLNKKVQEIVASLN